MLQEELNQHANVGGEATKPEAAKTAGTFDFERGTFIFAGPRSMLMDKVDDFALEVRDALTPKDDGGATQKQVLI